MIAIPPDDPFSIDPEAGLFSTVGRFSDFTAGAEGEMAVLTWAVDMAPGYELTDALVAIFVDGTFAESVPASSGYYAYPMPFDADRISLEALLVPAWDWEGWPHVPGWNPPHRVRLRWVLDGPTRAIEVFHGEGADPDPDTDTAVDYLETPTITLVSAAGSLSGAGFEADGEWLGDEDYAAIQVVISAGGIVGVATWTATHAGRTYTGTTSVDRGPLFLGIIGFWYEGITLLTGDTWTVRVGLPTTWESGYLPDGDHRFVVSSINGVGERGSTVALAATVDTFPLSPTVASVAFNYNGGNPRYAIAWTAPDEDDLSHAVLYRDRLGDGGEPTGVVHWLPEGTASIIGGVFTHTFEDLHPGLNRFLAHLVDEAGHEERGTGYVDLYLDNTLHEISPEPSAPFSIAAILLPSGAVQVTVAVDDTSDSVTLYTGDPEGAGVDYGTVVETIANPGTERLQFLTAELTIASDGWYAIGARAVNGTTEEKNLRYALVRVDAGPPVVPDQFTLEVF